MNIDLKYLIINHIEQFYSLNFSYKGLQEITLSRNEYYILI